MIDSLIKFFADYLRGRPITDCLLIVGIGVFIYFDYQHGQRADHAHSRVREILKERDEAEKERAERDDERTDKIIAVLTGVKTEIKKNTEATKEIPVAAAKAAARIVEGAADGKSE